MNASATSRRSARPRLVVEGRPGLGSVPLRHRLRRQLSPIVTRDRRAVRRDATANELLEVAGLAIMDAVNEGGHRQCRRRTRHQRVPPPVTSSRRAPPPQQSRHAMAITPGWFDRSPCGTGTKVPDGPTHARAARRGHRLRQRVLHRLPLRRSDHRCETTVGDRPAIQPTVTGRAWITGTAQYLLDPSDPFPAGFVL